VAAGDILKEASVSDKVVGMTLEEAVARGWQLIEAAPVAVAAGLRDTR
jgi:hypothetical protein